MQHSGIRVCLTPLRPCLFRYPTPIFFHLYPENQPSHCRRLRVPQCPAGPVMGRCRHSRRESMGLQGPTGSLGPELYTSERCNQDIPY
jgi:hypothetical protein